MKIRVNIFILGLVVIGLAICFFMTVRDFFYSVQTFFGQKDGEPLWLLAVAGLGMEFGIVSYTLTNREKHKPGADFIGTLGNYLAAHWKEVVMLAASCIVNTTYLWYEAGTKPHPTLSHYTTALVLGCIFPTIVLWLSGRFRDTFWETIAIYEQQLEEHDELAELRGRVGELAALQTSVQERDAIVQTLQTSVQERDAIVQTLQASVQERDAIVQTLQASVQERDALVQHLKAAVQERDVLVQDLKAAVQEDGKAAAECEILRKVVENREAHIKRLESRRHKVYINGNARDLFSTFRKWYDLDRAGDMEKADAALKTVQEELTNCIKHD